MRIAIAGCRGHWRYVFEALEATPEVEICAISTPDDDPKILKEYCIRAGFVVRTYPDVRQMLDVESPDILCVDGPFELHARYAIMALKRNIHVFCEKPVALSPEELAELERVWRESTAQIIPMVGSRFDPAIFTAYQLIAGGAVGKIKNIQAQKSYPIGSRPAFYHHRSTYGGTIPWVGSHAMDWILWFTGSEPEQFFALQDASDNFGNGTLEIAAQILMRLQNGVIASISMDFLRPNGSTPYGDDRIRVSGTAGVLEVVDGIVRLWDSSGEHRPDLRKPSTIFTDFVQSLQSGRTGTVTSEDTFRLMRACLAARQAADGEEVRK